MKTFIRAQGVIDGTGRGFAAGHGLLLDGDRIAAVGPAEGLAAQAEQVVDLSDTVLIPGFVDAHSHITIRPWEGDQHGQLRGPAVWQALRGVSNLARDLRSGVTTMRVMAEEFDIDVYFKAAVARGDVAGPRLYICGRGLSPTHGHGASLEGVDGPDALRRAVRENLRRGADHIKIFATGGVSSTDTSVDACNYTREEIRAVVEEAHRNGRKVAAHAHGGTGVDWCVEEGIDSIEHGALLTPGNVELMRRHGTWLVVTNTILFHPEGIEGGDAGQPAIMAKVRTARAHAERSFAMALEAGIRFAVGTDSMHGYFPYELEWLVAHGVSPEAALVAGTRHGAEVMGIDGEAGTLQPGRRADFVALAGNPLEDFSAIRRIVAVYKDGRQVVDRDGRIIN